MKDKIIFWIDSPGLYFGIAYFLQKNYDCDLFAIFDVTNKPKNFFQQQDLVKFQKTWFYHDHIAKNHDRVDEAYLQSFEKKYNIDLWKLAMNERFFYLYNDFYKFTSNEILSILEQECKLFEEVLDSVKPDFFITIDPPLHHHRLFYEMCRKRGVKVLLLHHSRLGNKMMISKDAERLDNYDVENTQLTNKSYEELQKCLDSFNRHEIQKNTNKKLFSSKSSLFQAAIKFLLFFENENIRTHYTYYGRTKFRVLSHKIIVELRQMYRNSFMNKNLLKGVDLTKPFIYFPLHMDMEQNPLITAPFYTNQVEVIRHIAKSLPIGYKIYVKEHPSQIHRGWRKISVYKEILDIPNVFLIHPSYPAQNLYRNCSLIITISGSSGLEGAFYKKPSIILTDLRYSILPSVYRLKSLEDLPNAIRTSLQKKVNAADLEKYLIHVDKNSFEFNYLDFVSKEANHFFFGGFLADTEILPSKVQYFLDENKDTLEKITMQYIKKIKQYKMASM